MNQERFDELAKAFATARISRGQVLKGLGAGFVVIGVLPAFVSKRVEAQDAGAAWSTIEKVTGTVGFTKTYVYNETTNSLSQSESRDMSSTATVEFELGAVSYEGTVDEERYYYGIGPRSGEYNREYKADYGHFVHGFTEHGSGSDPYGLTDDWLKLTVRPGKGLYSIYFFSDLKIDTTQNWYTLDRITGEYESGSKARSASIGVVLDNPNLHDVWQPLSGTTLAGSLSEGSETIDGKATLTWDFVGEGCAALGALSAAAAATCSTLKANPAVKTEDVVRGGKVVLDGSKSTGNITSYKWTFGPSTSDPSPDGVQPRSDAQKTDKKVTVKALLSFTATLTVSDGTNEDSESVEVKVTPRQKWETSFKQVKKEGILTGAPLRASNTTFSLGQNLCGEDYPKKKGYPANELDKQPPDYIHGEHELNLPVSERKLSWEGEAYQLSEPIADPGGPFDGYYYVAKGNLRIVRKVLLNEDLHNKQIRNFNLLADKANKKKIHDFDELVKQVRVHERLHSVLQKEALDDLKKKGEDPAKKIEAMVVAGKNGDKEEEDLIKKGLIQRADVAIVEANTAISDASAKEEEIGARIKKAHPEWDRQATILLPISDPAGEYKPVTFDNPALMGAGAVREE